MGNSRNSAEIPHFPYTSFPVGAYPIFRHFHGKIRCGSGLVPWEREGHGRAVRPGQKKERAGQKPGASAASQPRSIQISIFRIILEILQDVSRDLRIWRLLTQAAVTRFSYHQITPKPHYRSQGRWGEASETTNPILSSGNQRSAFQGFGGCSLLERVGGCWRPPKIQQKKHAMSWFWARCRRFPGENKNYFRIFKDSDPFGVGFADF